MDRTAQRRQAQRVTLIGAALDTLLGIAKVAVGMMVGSAALIADGIHSFSDLVTDGFVLAATHFGQQAPDSDHPYGHGRIETLATLWLGGILIFVAGGIAWASVARLVAGTPIGAPGLLAIALAVVALFGKEWCFRYTLTAARRLKSRLLEANAWHSRSDALSTLVVLIGLIGAQFGAGWLDAVAAILVAVLVGKIGGELLWEAGQELVDTALSDDIQQHMRKVALHVPGVRGVHDVRTRTIGGQVLLDLHLVVAPRISVSEGHEIGNEVSRRLRNAFPDLADVTFHIDPEDDEGQGDPSRFPGLPLRDTVERELMSAWAGQPEWENHLHLNLHYLDQRIDITLYLPGIPAECSAERSIATLQRRAAHLPWLGQISLWQAPQKPTCYPDSD
ncbi:cation diffusion facilitator family transporter [Pistricoccus aurantiacus]|nr:cation diffusion facilitator family transporter [Pistricoccus aurantiacus]